MEDEEASEDVFEVEDIMDAKISKNEPLYRVRWRGFDETHDTWEPRENLLTCDAILDRFMKTRCPKSARDCINFLHDEIQRKAKKTKSKNAAVSREKKEVQSDDQSSFVFSPGYDHRESRESSRKQNCKQDALTSTQATPVVKTRLKPNATEKVPTAQESRADRSFFVPATNLELGTGDDEFPLSLKELVMMGGTRSETRKIVSGSGDKNSRRKRVSPLRLKRIKRTENKVEEVVRRPRGRPRKHKLHLELEVKTGIVQDEETKQGGHALVKEVPEKQDEKLVAGEGVEDDREESGVVVSPRRRKARIITDDDDEDSGTEMRTTDDVCENGKSESVLTRGLFDIFASPNSQNGPRFGEEGAKEVIQQNGTTSLTGSQELSGDAVAVPCVDDSPMKSQIQEVVPSPPLSTVDSEPVEKSEDMLPADDDGLEFDFDDFSPNEDSDTETTERRTAGQETTGEFVPFVQLKQAVREGDVDVVRRALNGKCDVDQADGINGMTLLMWAAMEGQVEVAALLSRQANVNAKQRNGSTALMVSAEQGFENICEILIEAGAHVNIAQQTGETALMKAAKKGHVGTVNLLLRKGVDFRALSSFGHSAWSYAQRNHHIEVQTVIGHHTARVTRIFEGKASEIASREDEILVMPPIMLPTLRVPSEQPKMDFSFSLTPEHRLDGCEVNLFVLTVQLDSRGGMTVGELPPVTQYNFSCHFSAGRASWKNASVCLLPSVSSQNKLEFMATGFKSHENVLALAVYGVKKSRVIR